MDLNQKIFSAKDMLIAVSVTVLGVFLPFFINAGNRADLSEVRDLGIGVVDVVCFLGAFEGIKRLRQWLKVIQVVDEVLENDCDEDQK